MTSRSWVRGMIVAVVAFGLVSFVSACQKRSQTATPAATSTTTTLDSAAVATLDPGQQAYLTNCALCHGQWGGGDGPVADQMAKQAHVRPAALNDSARMSRLSREDLIAVIRKGGAHTGRSNLMPPWSDKLPETTIGQLADFVRLLPDLSPSMPAATVQAFLTSPPGSAPDGRKLFVFTCAMCHGPEGHGDGIMADTLWARNRIRPRNLTDSTYFATKTDQEIFATISLGGAHFHKSGYMPMWSVSLSPGQIKDLISYIRSISHPGSVPTP
jgi:mono/diheme cytochrome c family protein